MSDKPRSKEEAEAEVKRLKEDTLPTFFCPLIKGDCNVKCTCIGQPYMSGVNHEYNKPATLFRVYSWYCNNAMLSGHRENI